MSDDPRPDVGIVVDNGRRVSLIIAGIFEGVAGMSRGRVAFTPNRAGRSPLQAHGALLDGEPVQLTSVAPAEDGISFTAICEALS